MILKRFSSAIALKKVAILRKIAGFSVIFKCDEPAKVHNTVQNGALNHTFDDAIKMYFQTKNHHRTYSEYRTY